jgi:hypothetical protein
MRGESCAWSLGDTPERMTADSKKRKMAGFNLATRAKTVFNCISYFNIQAIEEYQSAVNH